MKIRMFLSLLCFLGAGYYGVNWIAIDTCLDAGGEIDKATSNCAGARDGFVPLLQRDLPITFYAAVLVVALIPSAIIYYAAGKFTNDKDKI